MSISNLTVHSFLLMNNCPFYECIQFSHCLNDRTASWLLFWVSINQARFRHWHACISFPSLALIKLLLLFYDFFFITAPLFSYFFLFACQVEGFLCGHPHAGWFPSYAHEPTEGILHFYLCFQHTCHPYSFHGAHFVPLALQAMINLTLYTIPQSFFTIKPWSWSPFFLPIWILASHFLNVLLLNARLNPGYQKTLHLDSECGVLWSRPGTMCVTLWLWVQETLVPSFSPSLLLP